MEALLIPSPAHPSPKGQEGAMIEKESEGRLIIVCTACGKTGRGVLRSDGKLACSHCGKVFEIGLKGREVITK